MTATGTPGDLVVDYLVTMQDAQRVEAGLACQQHQGARAPARRAMRRPRPPTRRQGGRWEVCRHGDRSWADPPEEFAEIDRTHGPVGGPGRGDLPDHRIESLQRDRRSLRRSERRGRRSKGRRRRESSYPPMCRPSRRHAVRRRCGGGLGPWRARSRSRSGGSGLGRRGLHRGFGRIRLGILRP